MRFFVSFDVIFNRTLRQGTDGAPDDPTDEHGQRGPKNDDFGGIARNGTDGDRRGETDQGKTRCDDACGDD